MIVPFQLMLISIFQSVRFFRLFVFVYPEHFNFRLACVQTPPPLKNERVGSYLTYTQHGMPMS